MSIVSMKKMLENGVHFGHQTRRWNPKMKPFIYTSRNGVYIVDLNQTQAQIEAAYNELKAISERGFFLSVNFDFSASFHFFDFY